MDNLGLFAIMDNSTKLLSNFFTCYDDKKAAEFILNQFNIMFDNLGDNNQKSMVLDNIRNSCVVKVGSIDVLTHSMHEDFNVLLILKDFKVQEAVNSEI